MLKMTSYMKFFEDFLQKKDNDVQQRNIGDVEDDENEHSSTTETVPSPKADTAPSTPSISPTPTKKMEHSYIRDTNPRPMSELTNGLPSTRTILVRRTPQCPSCHTHPVEEHDLDESNQAVVPAYNEIGAKEAMNECARIAKYVKNLNSDDEDWTTRVNQIGWSNLQKNIFEKIIKILDDDQLGRLANANRQHEAMHRRVVVDKSAARMRKLLASVSWDTRLTQWLHCLLMDCLPSTYMASYLDILQTLKSKVPILMDKMLFGRPLNISQELLAPVLKKKWEPQFNTKTHKLQQNAVIVALPSMPTSGAIPSRLQKWYQQLASITQIVQITLPMINNHTNTQPLEQIAEQIVSLTRVKIQELRNENPMRSVILIGFNAGAALALQVAMSETVACVICMGFAYNTIKGVRGTPEDRILDLKVPILFVVGRNSQRTSQEEMEFLREKMQSETSLVIVGGADDFLRVPKSRRQIENVTQSMVDAMVVDEVYEFIKRILTNPPGPRVPTNVGNTTQQKHSVRTVSVTGEKSSLSVQRKRKQDGTLDGDAPTKAKYPGTVGRPRTRPLPSAVVAQQKTKQITIAAANKGNSNLPGNAANEELNTAMQTLLAESGGEQEELNEAEPTQQKLVTKYELVSPPKVGGIINKTSTISGTKIKMIPSNQFLQIKPQQLQSQSKIYTIKTTPPQTNVTGGVQASTIGSIVRTTPNLIASGQQQIFTLKSPNGKTTQFVTAAPGSSGAPQKYTVVKNTATGTMLQLTTAKNVARVAAAAAATDDGSGAKKTNTAGDSSLDLSNIIDMPILFADSEGNFTDSATAEESHKPKLIVNKPTSSSGQLIISQKVIKEAHTSAALTGTIGATKGGAYVISKPVGTIIQASQLQSFANKTVTTTGTTTGANKVVFINRNTMKPCPNIMSRSNTTQSFPKYAKFLVSNPKGTTTSMITRPGVQITPTAGTSSGATRTAISSGNLISLSGKPVQIINKSVGNLHNATSTTTSIGGSAEKPTFIRNIVVKPSNLKQIPPHLTSQLINRNLTVRKLMNFVPGTGIVTTSATATAIASPTTTTSADATCSTSMQSTPKIIKLNPVNTINNSTQNKSSD